MSDIYAYIENNEVRVEVVNDDINVYFGTGQPGEDGWAPVLAVVADGAREVLQVADWIGGGGTKPATGQYIGPTGFVTLIGDAVNIKGSDGSSGDLETQLLAFPEYPNEPDAYAALGPNKIFWIGTETDTDFPLMLKKTRPA